MVLPDFLGGAIRFFKFFSGVSLLHIRPIISGISFLGTSEYPPLLKFSTYWYVPALGCEGLSCERSTDTLAGCRLSPHLRRDPLGQVVHEAVSHALARTEVGPIPAA